MKWHRILAAGLAMALLAGCTGGGVKPLTPDSGSAPAAGIPSDTADRALGDFGGRDRKSVV